MFVKVSSPLSCANKENVSNWWESLRALIAKIVDFIRSFFLSCFARKNEKIAKTPPPFISVLHPEKFHPRDLRLMIDPIRVASKLQRQNWRAQEHWFHRDLSHPCEAQSTSCQTQLIGKKKKIAIAFNGDTLRRVQCLAYAKKVSIAGKLIDCEWFSLINALEDSDIHFFLSDLLQKAIDQGLQKLVDTTSLSIWNLLKTVFVQCDEKIKDAYPAHGATGILALWIDPFLWVAHVGNLQAVLVDKNQQMHKLSTLEVPEDQRPRSSFEKRGGSWKIHTEGNQTKVDPFFRYHLRHQEPRAFGYGWQLGHHEGNNAYSCCARPKITRTPRTTVEGGILVLCSRWVSLSLNPETICVETHRFPETERRAAHLVQCASKNINPSQNKELSVIVIPF